MQTFWDSPFIATQAGLKAVDLFRAVEAGKIKAIWIMATNPVVSLPDADQVKRALENANWSLCQISVPIRILRLTPIFCFQL